MHTSVPMLDLHRCIRDRRAREPKPAMLRAADGRQIAVIIVLVAVDPATLGDGIGPRATVCDLSDGGPLLGLARSNDSAAANRAAAWLDFATGAGALVGVLRVNCFHRGPPVNRTQKPRVDHSRAEHNQLRPMLQEPTTLAVGEGSTVVASTRAISSEREAHGRPFRLRFAQ